MIRALILFLLIDLLLSNTATSAERIITLSPSSTEILYTIGAGNKIIATVEHADFPKDALSLPHVGNYQSLNVEAILLLKPDLIIAWPDGNPSAQLAQLEQFGLNIYYSRAKSLSTLGDEMITLGKLVGNEQQAVKAANNFNKKIANLTKAYSGKTKISLFYQVWPEPLMTTSSSSWLGEAFALCSGKNVFSNSVQPYPLISIEHVLLSKPEIILAADKNKQALDHWQQWPQLTAVKNNNLFILEPDHLHRYGPRLSLGVEELCEAIEKARVHKNVIK